MGVMCVEEIQIKKYNVDVIVMNYHVKPVGGNVKNIFVGLYKQKFYLLY